MTLTAFLSLRVVVPFLAGYFVSYVFRAVNAVLGPSLVSEFGISAAQLGLLTGVYFFSFGLFQVPLGVLLDRFGPRRTNGALLLLATAGALAFAYARSFEHLVLARALIGLGVSACLMASMQAFILWFPPERMSTMIALAYSMGGLGAIAASAPLELALRHYSWREIFEFLAFTTLFLSAVFAFWVPEHAPDHRPVGLREQLAGLKHIARDGAFWRVAIAIGANQCAVLSLFTLWITAWLRDVAGYERAAAAQALAIVALSLIAGYFFFGRIADARARRGRSQLPLFVGGVAAALVFLALIALGVVRGAVVLWAAFVFCGTGATLAHSIATRRYPRDMAGRVNTALNTFTFIGVFLGQWGTGAILSLWPPTATGYDPRAYVWAFGALWLVQAAGLAWLWRGRALLEKDVAIGGVERRSEHRAEHQPAQSEGQRGEHP
ncbi:MAG: MFS transporter [Betaproteobacteria bacterium]|nr:MAG: MFS transporter [Betaproteobacteria bacterium]